MLDNQEIRKRFCKDNNLPIKIFCSPYFEERFELYRRYFSIEDSITEFKKIIAHFANEQEYFALYNKIKDDIITYFQNSPEMIFFSQKEDMNKFAITHKNLPKTDIYSMHNVGRKFVSLDMSSANFTALRHYNPAIVKNKETYAEFMREFTDYPYFEKSKYLRQVVFGNVNPKRQITYEKFLMDKVLTLAENFIDIKYIVSFMNDEIVFDITDYPGDENLLLQEFKNLVEISALEGIFLKFEVFELRKVQNTTGYAKVFEDGHCVFKGLDSIEFPFVLRKYFNESPTENDGVFLDKDRLAKLLEPIEVNW